MLNLLISVNPSTPNILINVEHAKHSSSVTDFPEGTNVTFECFGDVGRPESQFVWYKRKDNDTTLLYSSINTTYVSEPELCTNNGTSLLRIRIDAEDKHAKFGCAIETEKESLFAETTAISVKCK